jgi:1-phosphofructokinase family hexose kinase
VTASRLVCIVPNPSIDKTAEIERLQPGVIHRPTDVLAVPGGKGLNVARAAHALGVPVEAVLLLGGHAGRWIDAALRGLGLAHHATWTAGETRTCLSVLDRSTGELTEFYEPGAEISAADWARFRRAVRRSVVAGGDEALIALSGSFPPGSPADAAATLVEIGRAARGRVLLDTSGSQLEAALGSAPFLVKVNAAEAAAVVGGAVTSEREAVEAATELVARGARQAVVTRGAAGAVGWDGQAAWTTESPGGGGPYVVGSGDAFLAGFATGLRRGEPFDGCLRRAAAAATAATLVPGPGNLDVAAAERALAGTRVRRLA